MDPIEIRVGCAIRDERRAQSITIADLAARSGMSPDALSRVEKCERRLSLAEVIALCRVLGLTLDAIVGDLTATVVYPYEPRPAPRRYQSWKTTPVPDWPDTPERVTAD
jgi:transcriptional regulator with XRE-family HTH domain